MRKILDAIKMCDKVLKSKNKQSHEYNNIHDDEINLVSDIWVYTPVWSSQPVVLAHI